jgi:hypothetical protein
MDVHRLVTEPLSYRRLLLLLGLAWFLLNASVLAGGHVLPWDALDQFYPTVYFNAHALRAGMLPWWNPYIYAGYASVGDPQGMLFSPLLMAWMILPAHPGAWWFGWGVLLHVLMGGAAMLAVMRRHGMSALGALLGAMVYMAGGVAASRLEHVPIVIAYAYAPVVLITLRRLVERPGLLRGIVLGVAIGALVVQLVQLTYLLVLFTAAYGCFAVTRAWSACTNDTRWRLVGGMVAAAVVALAIGLPQLLFSWASVQLSNRTDLPLAAAEEGSLDLRALWFFFNPNAYGALRDIHAPPIDPIQAFLYIGILPTLALAGVVRAWREPARRRAILCFAGLALIAGLYMVGTHGPLYGWLYRWMPGLAHFRRPSDAAYLLNMALAFLVGIGASQLRWGDRREVSGLLGAAMAWSLVIAALSRSAAPLGVLVIAALALWRLRHPGTRWRTIAWVFVVLVADYRVFNFNGTFTDTGNGAARFTAQPAVGYLAGGLAAEAGHAARRFTTQGMTTLWDNMGEVVGLASTQGYNPLRYALYEKAYQPRESANAPVPLAPYNALPAGRLDDLLGVRYVVAGHGEGIAASLPPDYVKVAGFAKADVWRNDGAYPRFLNPTDTRLTATGAWPDVDDYAGTNFATTLWLTPRDADDLERAHLDVEACHGSVDAELRGDEPSLTRLDTRSVQGGWLAIGELDHPGWEATLDGQPLPIHRANGMFRAVCVPAGNHALTFRFNPWRMVAYAWQHRA